MTAKKTRRPAKNGLSLVIPFLLTLAVLTVISFCIPLRPTRSQMEKRDLAPFPEFSWSTLVEGTYFDDITTWFSDTFPGRESWLTLSSQISGLHGYSEIAIAGDLPEVDHIPPAEVPTEAQQEAPAPSEQLPETIPEGTAAMEETVPSETGWGGANAGDEAAVELGDGAVIQIGDAAFNAVGFSQLYSDKYIATLNGFAEKMKDKGIRIVSAPAPTAMGILVEPAYLEMLNSADQKATIDYLHSQMDESIVKVDAFSALIEHNDEYIYFRTDHHWTALGAYYGYEVLCQALGMEPLPLEDFELWNQGEMEGSLYWKVKYPKKLTLDTIDTYLPPYNIEVKIQGNNGGIREGKLVQDVTDWPINSKYSAFICSDNPVTIITNHDLPDGPSCILVKDSFGNALAPFLAANYHEIHVIDYRKYWGTLNLYMRDHPVDDVIFAPYLIGTQAMDGNEMIANKCR